MAKSQKHNKTNKIDINENFEKIKKLPLEYVLKNIPVKFGNDPSILRQRKLEMMNLTDRHTDKQTNRHTDRQTFFHWLFLGPTGLKQTLFF